jgi:malate dehydrogenase
MKIIFSYLQQRACFSYLRGSKANSFKPLSYMKVTVVGAGNVGATCANVIAHKELVNEVILLDIKEGTAEGKSLDMWQTAPINMYDTRIKGVTNDYAATADSDVVVITSGLPRKPGMSRDDLIATNAGIVKSVTENIVKYSPNTIIIVVSNPLDVMTYCSYLTAGFDSKRVFGMAGILDTARYCAFLAEALNTSPKDIKAVLMGGHGDTMVPLPRYTTVAGIPVTELISADKLEAIVQRTKVGGGELVNLMGTSAWYAPGAAAAQMVEAIVRDQKRIFPVCAWLQGEYGMKDVYLGVPVKLGKNGIEEIIELKLNTDEMDLLNKSSVAVKEVMSVLDKMSETVK